MVLPNVSLFVPAGQSPTAFLPGGPFRAVWEGMLSAELRGEYRFQAELRGEFHLQLNGTSVLESAGTDARTATSQTMRLNKGTNLLTATFRSPPSGDAYVRLSWIPIDSFPSPIPSLALSHNADSDKLQNATQLRVGRELFLEHSCAKCHRVGTVEPSAEKLSEDAPSFEGIGSRRRFEWLAEWIRDPKAQRISARMPRVFHRPAQGESEAAAAFLSTLRDPGVTLADVGSGLAPAPGSALSAEDLSASKQAGQTLFEKLHCVACHDSPETNDSDARRVSLKAVARKFPSGALATFLQHPEAHYAWIRMPNFKLTNDEAKQISAYLEARAEKALPATNAIPPEWIDRGQRLVQTSGCLNCHGLKLENQFVAKPLAELSGSRWETGCLAVSPLTNSSAPFFAFSVQEREALQAFARTDRSSLRREAPMEIAQRQIEVLRCSECHGKFEGFPPLNILGGKLKPEWARDFIAGELDYRPRHWLTARMPAFPKYAWSLAAGMAMQHGYPPVTPPEPPLDLEGAKIGQRLVSAEGGLSCIACHAVGEVSATQVFENAGINLAYTSARLLKPFYERWLRNPLAIDPVSKMPVFFDEELRSILQDFYNGDGRKQIEAIWQYIRLGDKMPSPVGLPPAQ